MDNLTLAQMFMAEAKRQEKLQEYKINVSTGWIGGPHKNEWFGSFDEDELGLWESDYCPTRKEAEDAALKAYEEMYK